MGYKLIAIGNRLMGDEGIAIRVAELLKDEPKLSSIEIIIGKTDVAYCESQIEDQDFIILLDATCFGIDPGSVTVMSLNKGSTFLQHTFTQYDLNMPRVIEINQKDVTAYLIGIEIEAIKFDENLSSTLCNNLNEISSKVKKCILKLINNSANTELEA